MERTKQSSRMIEMIQQQLKRARTDIGQPGWVSPLNNYGQPQGVQPVHQPEKYVLCSVGCGATHHEKYAHHPCKGGK